MVRDRAARGADPRPAIDAQAFDLAAAVCLPPRRPDASGDPGDRRGRGTDHDPRRPRSGDRVGRPGVYLSCRTRSRGCSTSAARRPPVRGSGPRGLSEPEPRWAPSRSSRSAHDRAGVRRSSRESEDDLFAWVIDAQVMPGTRPWRPPRRAGLPADRGPASRPRLVPTTGPPTGPRRDAPYGRI